jgi:TPR repeat protein
MCGTPVAAQSAEDDLPTAEHPQQSEPAFPQNNESPFARSKDAVYEPALSTNELSLFQAGRETTYRREGSDNEDEIFSYSPASRSYRVYVGIALAIVIFALAYMAWRGAQATSQSSHVEPQAPPAVTQPAVPAPTPPSTPPSTSKTDPSEGTPPANEQATAPSEGRAQVESGQVESTAKPSSDKAAQATPPPAPVAETNPSEPSVSGNGAEELAVAERYLNGGNGLQRNSAEGARWLWKSMAKNNANATLLLADLYLKGDGVSKNCDQARVLLDSAARSGMKQAGERLRHLQAFGCE